MLHLNKTIIPNPTTPEALDAYGGETGPELVVVAVDQQKLHPAQRMLDLEAIARGDTSGEERVVLTCAFRGTMVDVLRDRFAAVLASAGLRPLGRMERTERGVKPRPEVPLAILGQESTHELASKIADHLLACKFIEAGTGQDVERSLIFLLGAASE